MHINNEYQSFKLISSDMPGFNEMIAAAKTFGRTRNTYNGYASMKKKWCNKLCKAIKTSKIYPIDKLFLHLIWYEPNKGIKRDPDNIAAFIKFILDALQEEKIINNDSFDHIIGWENEFKLVSGTRGVEVKIYDKETYPNRNKEV